MRVAAVQMNSTEDTARNLERADRLVRAAAAAGARLVALPEKWTVLGTPEQLAAGAQPLDGEAVRWARATARELGIDLLAGSFVEAVEGEALHRNTSVLVRADGELAAVYRKVHLFDVEVGGRVYRESATEGPGEELVVARLSDGPVLGLSVCYDVRFPELYRELTAAGAQVLAVPAAFTLATTRDHWELLLRARAVENACFVVAPNQIGVAGGGAESGGRSAIVDPWGVVLAVAPDAEGYVVADLDLALQEDVRRRLPSFAHRRTDVYARGVAGAGVPA